MNRKRRSNRLTAEQLEARKDALDSKLHQLTILIGFGQEHLEWFESMYRSVSLKVALKMVADGEAEKFEADSDNGRITLFRETKPFKGVQYQLPTMPNAESADAMAAYTPGARMCRRQRERVEHILAFPLICDTKAPLVSPRISQQDREAGEKLLGMHVQPSPSRPNHRLRTRTWYPDMQAAA